jgi:pilus assembly protein CpaE
MKTTAVRIIIVGSNDRQLQEMLRTAGGSITMQSMEALATLAHPSAAAPDALIVDLREDSAFPPALATFKRHHPTAGVVIVARQLDPALMLEAMRAGVSEWLVDPLAASSLTAAIDRVVSQRVVKGTMGQVFAFVGAKGGVGTTTTAVNVATALGSNAPRKTLLMDLHLTHGDAALFMGVEPKFSVADALENSHRLDEAFFRGLVTHAKGGVDLLASSERTATAAPDVTAVRHLIEFAAQHYQYVCLDVPRSDVTVLDSLELASSIIVVANQELATVRRAGPLVLALRQRYGKERVGVVVTRFDKHAEIQREDIERVTGGAVRHIIPSDYRLALGSLNKGQPLVVENHNRLAASFMSLASLLAGLETQKPSSSAKPSGIFGRLGVR